MPISSTRRGRGAHKYGQEFAGVAGNVEHATRALGRRGIVYSPKHSSSAFKASSESSMIILEFYAGGNLAANSTEQGSSLMYAHIIGIIQQAVFNRGIKSSR